MANGIPKAASVYFEDATSYTGDPGVKTNPYCIEDLYDFEFFVRDSSVGDIHKDHYLILVKDIDLNDYDAGYLITGTDGNKLLSFRSLDGKGHEIRNISFVEINKVSPTFMRIYNLDGTIYFKNINFLNINYYNSNGSLFESNYNGVALNFNNCNFTVYNYKRNAKNVNKTFLVDNLSNYAYNYIFNYCTFNIKCSPNINYLTSGLGIIHYGQFYYCHINIEVMHGFSGLIDGYNKFIFSYITIKCHYLFDDFKQNIPISSTDSNKKTVVGLIEDGNSTSSMSSFSGSYIYIKLINTMDTEYDPLLTFRRSALTTNTSNFYLETYFKNYPNTSNVTGSSFIVLDQDGEKNQVSLYPEPVADTSVPEVKIWNNKVWYVLTKEQAKDPELLAKIDFPCLPYNE